MTHRRRTSKRPKKSNGQKGGKERTKKEMPTIIAVDERGKRECGTISRTTAWRAGRFWEDMEMTVKVFMQKGDKRTPEVEERIEGGRKRFWFEGNPPQPQ